MSEEKEAAKPADIDAELAELRRISRELDDSLVRESALTELPDHSHPTLDRRAKPRLEPTRVAATETPEVLTKDFHYTVDVVEGGMAAKMSLFPPTGKGKLPDLAGLIQILKSKKIKSGIIEEECKKILSEVASSGVAVKDRIVARGAPAEHGKNSELEVTPSFISKAEFVKKYPEEPISGLQGVEEFEKLAKVKENEEIARFLPAHPGKGGFTVTGIALPAKKGTALHFVGSNVLNDKVADSSKESWKAEFDGIAVIYRNKLSVLTYTDALVKVVCEEGDYSAVLQLIAPTGLWRAPTLEAVHETIKKAGVVFGLDLPKIESEHALFCKERKSRVFVCATGVRPKEGATGEINFHLDLSYKPVLQEDDQGRIDYRIRQNVILVKKDDLICEIHRPKEEDKKGTTVKGKVVTFKDGKNLDLKALEGIRSTALTSEHSQLHADQDGEVIYEASRGEIRVSQTKIINSVDLAFGNLTFVGNVTVNKNIEDGMKVIVNGDLHVKGMILGAKVQVKGAISCEGGIITKQQGFVECEGDLKARFVENSIVRTSGNVLVEKSILQSRIATLGSITLNGEKSVLMGGSLQAKNGVTLRHLGNETGTHATVYVGMDFKALARYHQIVAKIRVLQDETFGVEREIEMMGETDKEKLKGLLLSKSSKLAEILALRTEGKGIYDRLEAPTPSELKITGKAHPQNIIRFGAETLILKQTLANVKFFQDAQTREIRQAPLVPQAKRPR